MSKDSAGRPASLEPPNQGSAGAQSTEKKKESLLDYFVKGNTISYENVPDLFHTVRKYDKQYSRSALVRRNATRLNKIQAPSLLLLNSLVCCYKANINDVC